MSSVLFARLNAARRGHKTAALKMAAVFALAALAATFPASAHAGVEEGRAKSQVCAACHGVDGNSVIPTIPSLAGQPRQFITQALFMFREGQRKNEQMTPFAAKLSNADLNDLAQYYSAQKMALPTRQPEPGIVLSGQAVTEKNNCVACHKPTLVGQQHIPRLAGQHKPYLLEQLKAFKAATRADLDGTMTSAAQGLALDELEVVAEYLATFVAP
jgi:cytochrome c553